MTDVAKFNAGSYRKVLMVVWAAYSCSCGWWEVLHLLHHGKVE